MNADKTPLSVRTNDDNLPLLMHFFTETFMAVSKKQLVAGLTLVLALIAQTGWGAILETQHFITEVHAIASGWTELGSRDAGSSGNNYGYSATNNTGGDSQGGEAGGVFARHDTNGSLKFSYYADTTLEGPFDVYDSVSASGELYINNPLVASGHDATIYVGFFNSTFTTPGSAAADNVMGFQLRNDNRIAANAYGGANNSGINSDGSSQGLSNLSGVLANGTYTFEMTWTAYPIAGAFSAYVNPGNLSVKIWDSSNVLVADLAQAFTSGQNRSTRIISAFGLLNSGNA